MRFPQTSLVLHSVLDAKGAVNALQQFTAQPNAHLHGGAGVFYKQINDTGINEKVSDAGINKEVYDTGIYKFALSDTALYDPHI